MEQRLELARHHEIDEEDRKADRERQAREGALHFLALSPEAGGDAGREPEPGDVGPDCLGGLFQVRSVEVARDHHRGPLSDPAQFGGTLADLRVSERPQRHWARLLGVDDQFRHRRGAGAQTFAPAHHHVDAPVALVEPGGDLAAQFGAKPLGSLVHGEPHAREPVGGEPNPDLGAPGLGGRAHVGEPRNLGDRRLHPAGARHQQRPVLGIDLDFDRLAETEVGRPAELVADPGPCGEVRADPVDERRLGFLVAGVRHRHLDSALVFGATRTAREAASRGSARLGGHPEHRRVLEGGLGDRVHHRVGGGHGGPLGEVDVEVELALGERRDQFHADAGPAHRQRTGEEPGGQRKDDDGVAEGRAQHRRVGAGESAFRRGEARSHRAQRVHQRPSDLPDGGAQPAERPDGRCRPLLTDVPRRDHPPAREHRNQRQREAEGGEDGDGDGERLVTEELAGDPFHEHDRQEDGDGGQGRSHNGAGDLHGALHRRFARALAAGVAAVDRLEHHDRVVEQHADPERQPAERHDVQREPHLLHHEEGGDHRDRNGHGDHGGAAAVPEEERDDQDGEQASLPGVPHHFGDGALDELGLVEEDRQREAGGNRVLHRFELRADGVGDLDGVRVPLLEDADLDALGAALPQDHLLVLEPGADLRHVAEPHEPSLGVLHDYRAHAVQGVQLVQGADQVAGLVLVDAAAGEVHVVVGERGPDLRDRDAVGGQPAFVHVHLDLPDQASFDTHRGNPVHCVEVLLEVLFGPLTDRGEREVAGDADPEDRVRCRVEAQQPRPFGVFGKEDAVELLPHVEPGEVHVGVPDELEGDFGRPGAGPGRDAPQAGNDRCGLLDRPGHQRFHLDGRGARHPGLDRQGGIRDLGQQVDGQPAEGHKSEDAGGHGEHGDGHRPPDAGGDQGLHGAESVSGISCSGFRRMCPGQGRRGRRPRSTLPVRARPRAR